MSMNELFNTEETSRRRELDGTAELTRISSIAANTIIQKMDADIDNYRARIAESAKDHNMMDKLLDEFRPWCDIEEDSVLSNLSEETVESMLRSQQSKRSRSKAKDMTLDNYRTMMTAAIAENLLRDVYDKPKQHIVGSRRSSVEYTPAELEELAADQVALGKAIRNIQSKKSLMKKKEDFSEADERWQTLLKYEAILKDLRADRSDDTKDKLNEQFDGVDMENITAEEALELLKSIKTIVE